MKILVVIVLLILTISCRKNLNSDPDASITSSISSNALAPLKYHAISFTTGYPLLPGKVPPFTFTKTLYSDTRVKTLYMKSRFDANTASSTNQYYVWNYTFTYGTSSAKAKGTRKLYNAKTGLLVRTFQDDLSFTFNSLGICTKITRQGNAEPLYYLLANSSVEMVFNTELYGFVGYKDSRGNVARYEGAWMSGYGNFITYTYDLSVAPKGSVFYQPTQYALDHWYSLLEVMQWAPAKMRNPRKSVTLAISSPIPGEIEGYPTPHHIYQGQKYLNHRYDVNGNLTSYTYGDGVLQKITWK